MDKQLPVLLKPMPGSVRDVKALRTVIDEVNAKESTVVIDRGFASNVIPDLMTELNFNFILPLRRNFTEIDYNWRLDYTFSYRKRGIKWGRKRIGANFLYMFEDVKLRAEEETTFIHLMNEKKRNTEEYKEASKQFGKIAILSNRYEDGETIYLMWTGRTSRLLLMHSRMNLKMIKHIWTMMKQSEDISSFHSYPSIFIIKSSTYYEKQNS